MQPILRHAEIQDMLKAMGLLAPKILSKMVLTGPAKIGKTSMLCRIEEHGAAMIRQYSGREGYMFVYVDLSLVLTIEDLRRQLIKALEGKSDIPVADNYDTPIPDVVTNANKLGLVPIFLYDHFHRALEINALQLGNYYEIFAEGRDTLRFAWIAVVTAHDKNAYVGRLRQEKYGYAAAVSAILDRTLEYKLRQMTARDADEFVCALLMSRGMALDQAVAEQLYDELGGLPFLLERAVGYVDKHGGWAQRDSFREFIKDDIYRYYLPTAPAGDMDRFWQSVQRGVDQVSGEVQPSYRQFFIDRGICPPERTRVPALLWELAREHIDAREDETFFAFLVDHENLYWGLKRWFLRNGPAVANFSNRRNKSIFEHEYHILPRVYYKEQEKLMKHVIEKFKQAWKTLYGADRMQYCKAYAKWKTGPAAHQDVYDNDLMFIADEPDIVVRKDSQAVDMKIQADISFEVEKQLQKYGQRTRVKYIFVTGDADYGQFAKSLFHQGKDVEFWCFNSQKNAPFLKSLDDAHRKWLEDILDLKNFSLDI